MTSETEALRLAITHIEHMAAWNTRPLQAEGAPAAEGLTALIAWHTQERAAWLNVRASNAPGYTERMAKFHSDAIATLRGLHA